MEEENGLDKGGCIACFSVPNGIGEQIAIDGYESVDDLHITLLKMKYNDLMGSEKDMRYNVLSSLFKLGEPSSIGKIEGLTRFSDVQDGTKDAIVLNVTISPDLYTWRKDFISVLNMNGIEVYNNYVFRPHITLAYVDTDVEIDLNKDNITGVCNKEIDFGSLEIRYNNNIFKL